MKIAIYHHGIEFDGTTPFIQPLGGSESGIVYVARELTRLGHEVTVYAKMPNSLRSDSKEPFPAYVHYHRFFADYLSSPWDVVISFRSFDPFLLGRVAPRMIFWCGDSYDQPVLKDFGHQALQENIDLIFCVSEWHRRTFIETFKLPAAKVIATRNGFFRDLVSSDARREWTRSAYTSTPYRGLDVLLRIFPKIRAQVASLTLDVFSSMKVYGWTGERDQREFGSVYAEANQPGVILRGGLPQPVLLKQLAATGLLLYPNTFEETSCIAAIEAQASGCVVVTSARAGLNETVEHEKTGICIKGDPESDRYQREFIAAAVGLLQNPSRLIEFSEAARHRAFRLYDWAVIVSEWTGIFEAMVPQPVHRRWSGPLCLLQKTHEYLQNGNVNAASRVLAVLEKTPFLRNEVAAVKGKLGTWM
jgi:glycosyltransferase involved in cell wall biosynthesis